MPQEKHPAHQPHEMNWHEFTEAHPMFVDAVNDGLSLIVTLAHEGAKTTEADHAVASLTGSLAENLADVMLLCSKERRDGALRLLRTPYEKFLYAHHITAHPDTAEDFNLFWAIQSKQLLDGLNEHYGIAISEQGNEGLALMLEAATTKIKRNKCEACGGRLPRMWTKVTPEEMAKHANVGQFHVFAYRYATLMIHPTVTGIKAQANQSLQLPNILLHVHTIVIETLKLQWKRSKASNTVTGEPAYVFNRLVAAFASHAEVPQL